MDADRNTFMVLPAEFRFKVVKVIPVTVLDTVITVTTANINYGETETIEFTLKDAYGKDLSATLNVTIGQLEKTVNVTDGKGSIDISNLTADTYPVVAKFQGNESYGASIGTNYFVVSRNATQIIFENMNTTAVAPSEGKIGEWSTLH